MKKFFYIIINFLFNINVPDEEQMEENIKQVIAEPEPEPQSLDESQLEKSEEPEEPKAAITFYIDDNNNVNIRYFWNNKTDLLAIQIAQMLNYINSGQIEEGCFNVMQEVAKENPDEQGFIKDIVENWKKIKNEEDILIKPSEVFGVGPTRDNRK